MKSEMTEEEKMIKKEVDEMISNMACCDRDGCRCDQAKIYLRQVAKYASAQGRAQRRGEVR